MAAIRLENPKQEGYTLLPDEFTDHYMASANGEFVKVYICILRFAQKGTGTFDMAAMADLLRCNERDIVRALKYWADKGLVSLRFSDKGEITSLSLCPFPASENASSGAESPKAAVRSSSGSIPGSSPSGRFTLTPGRISELQENQAVAELLFVAEQYIGRPLTSTEMNSILYFYDGISMSPELIQYLIEYCVSNGHKSVRYMESVALAWQEKGITTVQEAQDSVFKYSKDYFSVMKALGITGRNPVPEEITFINTWYHDYGFSLELIQEACSRTVMSTGQASFQYTDRILSDWKKQNVHSLSDVKELDARHRQQSESHPRKTAANARTNRFNNFPQRQYDFAEYEKQLINSNR